MNLERTKCLLGKTAVAGVFVLQANLVLPALADDAPAAKIDESAKQTSESSAGSGKSDGTPGATADAPAKKTKVLEGGVKGTAVLFEEGLARIGAGDEAVQESCMKIIKESTRKDTIVMRGPNAIGNGIVIPAMGGEGGVMQMGELPIRRNKLNAYIDESTQSMAALQSYVDALILPPGNAQAEAAYSELRSLMQSAQDHLARLQELASAKRLVNLPISKEALAIHDAIRSMERNRSQLATILKPTDGTVVTTPEEESQKQ